MFSKMKSTTFESSRCLFWVSSNLQNKQSRSSSGRTLNSPVSGWADSAPEQSLAQTLLWLPGSFLSLHRLSALIFASRGSSTLPFLPLRVRNDLLNIFSSEPPITQLRVARTLSQEQMPTSDINIQVFTKVGI